ncbi:class I SAM-dependent methyltransferase [Halioxenophilus aromaticivorans]|uniref:Class I SAM-dependent methyltransferase n=1 Tax=Halioxenophilus aromaticivorans TaxID=1306992 RepID=A0AAV3U5S4_9ALTE
MSVALANSPVVCLNCHAGEMEIFHRAENVPVNSCILLDSKQAAQSYPKGRIELGYCRHCGFISNTTFNPKLTEYSGRYEETQGFSGTFQKFHHKLAERLIEKHNLHEKDIIEIGCGKGEFLALLCSLGENRGTGFDPGVDVQRLADSPVAERTQFIADFYSEKYANHNADFYVCKMTLEHIHPTGDFIATVRRAIGDRAGTTVFFQIPESTRILREIAFEDIYYEHCSYFTPESLRYLFEQNGFAVDDVATEYADQYLTIEAYAISDTDAAPVTDTDLSALTDLVATFPERFQAKQQEWQSRLNDYASQGKKVILWGGGSKAVAFLSDFDTNATVEYVVDINPYRQGHFLPGSGIPIAGPEFLTDYKPDVVVIMNAVYCDEISADLTRLGLAPTIIAL